MNGATDTQEVKKQRALVHAYYDLGLTFSARTKWAEELGRQASILCVSFGTAATRPAAFLRMFDNMVLTLSPYKPSLQAYAGNPQGAFQYLLQQGILECMAYDVQQQSKEHFVKNDVKQLHEGIALLSSLEFNNLTRDALWSIFDFRAYPYKSPVNASKIVAAGMIYDLTNGFHFVDAPKAVLDQWPEARRELFGELNQACDKSPELELELRTLLKAHQRGQVSAPRPRG